MIFHGEENTLSEADKNLLRRAKAAGLLYGTSWSARATPDEPRKFQGFTAGQYDREVFERLVAIVEAAGGLKR